MGSNTPSGAYYASVQDVMAAQDFPETSRLLPQIKQALATATDFVASSLARDFFPLLETRKFDWPQEEVMPPWRLWLNANELISVTSIVSGGISIPNANVILEPQYSGPPYNRIETNLGSSSTFYAGNTWQQAVVITGVWGFWANADAIGTLSSGINASVTSLTVSDSSRLGIGNVILIDSEYMIVTARTQVTTSQTLQTPLTALVSNNIVAVTTGSSYTIGETILLDSEQMQIVDIAANNLIVKRAFNGTVLATHTGSTIFAPRSYTVVRGTLGTTAATHSSAATVSLHVIPPAVQALTLAEAMWNLQGNMSAWQTSIGDKGKNQPSLKDLQDQRAMCARSYGRKARTRAI
jgi:hypothetical protein